MTTTILPYTICDLERIAKLATEQIAHEFCEARFVSSPPHFTSGMIRIVLVNAGAPDLLAACKAAASKPAEAAAIMRENDIKIDDHDDPYQKLAFTFYTMLVELAYDAERVIALAEATP